MKRLYRSTTDRQIAGVCGGLGEMFSIDPTLVRLAFVFITIVTGLLPMVLTYGIAWIIIPQNTHGQGPYVETR